MQSSANIPSLTTPQTGAEPDRAGFGAPPADYAQKIHTIYDYWLAKKGTARVADRKDLDPIIEIPKLLSGVWLVDIIHTQPRRFTYRLIGSDLTRAGVDSKVGDDIDSRTSGEDAHATIMDLNRACEEQVPYWRSGTPRIVHDRFVKGLEVIFLPLTVDRSPEVKMFMNMTVFRWRSQ
ncbi:PAS domain-containing protein [Minwuia sp.]|uniref:PAS domain-containing protein n=1 Tax=Minwuia sp. TaxID=2493630 RepID=UPI003A8D2BB5